MQTTGIYLFLRNRRVVLLSSMALTFASVLPGAAQSSVQPDSSTTGQANTASTGQKKNTSGTTGLKRRSDKISVVLL
jgi:hypothetical protein